MILTIITAHDPNLVIGKNGGLPWHYSEDLKFFKRTTMGAPVIMGRVVFEELNEKPLPGRKNIVLSRSKQYSSVDTFTDIDQALEHVKDEDRVFIIGGGEIYRQTLDRADELIVTEIKREYPGDTYFPEYRDQIGTKWKEIWSEPHAEFTFKKFKKINL